MSIFSYCVITHTCIIIFMVIIMIIVIVIIERREYFCLYCGVVFSIVFVTYV